MNDATVIGLASIVVSGLTIAWGIAWVPSFLVRTRAWWAASIGKSLPIIVDTSEEPHVWQHAKVCICSNPICASSDNWHDATSRMKLSK
jgi:hypothetical protein